jgi:nucleoside-diphosphate-sugar epimerase
MTGLAGRRVALIGGGGFIGHHLAITLAHAGAEVSVIDSLQVNNLLAVASGQGYERNRDLYMHMLNDRLARLGEAEVPLLVQDARDYHALGRLLAQIEPEVIVHLAAVAHATRSNKDPYSTFDHSLRTLENALDYARDSAEHFVFFSSSMVYGNFQTPVVDEAADLDPVGIYGALKVAGEKIVIAYNQVFGLDYTIIRPSALYGPRCVSGRVGQVFVENALRGDPLVVRGDGGGRLDFTYVDDLVQGVCKVIARPEARNEIFNLTYGAARPIAEVAAIVHEHFPEVEVRTDTFVDDPFMPERGTLSVEKARRLIGYDPQYPIEAGFASYISWYREFHPSPALR